jgi:hypothetical protein
MLVRFTAILEVTHEVAEKYGVMVAQVPLDSTLARMIIGLLQWLTRFGADHE